LVITFHCPINTKMFKVGYRIPSIFYPEAFGTFEGREIIKVALP